MSCSDKGWGREGCEPAFGDVSGELDGIEFERSQLFGGMILPCRKPRFLL